MIMKFWTVLRELFEATLRSTSPHRARECLRSAYSVLFFMCQTAENFLKVFVRFGYFMHVWELDSLCIALRPTSFLVDVVSQSPLPFSCLTCQMSSWSSWNPLIAGSAAGMASTLVAHPMDTIRTRLQTSSRFSGAIDCMRQTVANEGFRALYKGMAFPLGAQAVYKSVMFSAYTYGQKLLRGGDASRQLSIAEMALCGSFAGGLNTLVVTPVELVRNRLMVQYAATGTPAAAAGVAGAASAAAVTAYRGPMDAVRTIVATGGIASLWRGLSVTLMRDIPGVAGFYGANELAKKHLAAASDALSPGVRNIIAGAAGGIGFWTLALPLDTIKSRVQTNTTGASPAVIVRDLLREAGVAGLYRGWSVAFTRGIPGAATVFYTFDTVNRWLVEQQQQQGQTAL
jgi:solute carrier family 25 carnitine/acylcarnitine transporter 20/29